MSEIDWDKAPEGATHYVIGWGFFKLDLAGWFICDDGEKVWRKTPYQSPDNFSWWGNAVKRPSPAWSGEGLPPVGVECLAFYMGQPQGVVKIRYSGEWMILWSQDRRAEQCGAAEHYLFRPIRTPEQIAADEREAAINDLENLICAFASHRDAAIHIYDVEGYRKP